MPIPGRYKYVRISRFGQIRERLLRANCGRTGTSSHWAKNDPNVYNSAGSNVYGERTANLLTLIETAKLNGLDPEGYLTEVITRIASVKSRKLRELLRCGLER